MKSPVVAGVMVITVGMLLIGLPMMRCASCTDARQRWLDICVNMGTGFVSSGATMILSWILWEARKEYEERLAKLSEKGKCADKADW